MDGIVEAMSMVNEITPLKFINLLAVDTAWSLQYDSGVVVCTSDNTYSRLLNEQVLSILDGTVVTGIELLVEGNEPFILITIKDMDDVFSV